MECKRCNKEIPQKDALQCSICDDYFHYACVKMSETNFRKMSSTNLASWKCTACKLDIRGMFEGLQSQLVESFTKTNALIEGVKVKIDTCIKNYEELNTKVDDLAGDVKSLKDANLAARVKEIEDKLNSPAPIPSTSSAPNQPAAIEEICAELEDRRRRATNIMVYKFPEPTGSNAREEMENDLIKLKEVMNALSPDLGVSVQRVMRIGSRVPEAPRPMKIVFDSPSSAMKALVANRSSRPPLLNASSDRTPKQRDHLKSLRATLEEMVKNGDTSHTIKYEHGIPKIVPKPSGSAPPKTGN